MPSIAKTYYLSGRVTPIDIKENSGNNLIDYQVMIQLTSSWDGWRYVRSDASDIYFTDSGGNPLYFWIEAWDYANKNAIIWVKVPLIPANGVARIYLYYGGANPYSSYRSADKTFIFFDDFLGSSLDTSKWQVVWNDGYATVTISNSVLSIYDNSGHSAWYAYAIQGKTSFGINKALEAKVRYVYGGTYPNSRRFLAMKNSGDTYIVDALDGRATVTPDHVAQYYQRSTWTSNYTEVGLINRKAGSSTTVKDNNAQNWNTWLRTRLTWTPSITRYIENNSQRFSNTGTIPTINQAVQILLSRGANDGTAGLEVDWVAVRNYVEPEPSVTINPSSPPRDLDLV